MWPNQLGTADLITFTEETLKLHFLWSALFRIVELSGQLQNISVLIGPYFEFLLSDITNVL